MLKLGVITALLCVVVVAYDYPFRNPTLPWKTRVKDLVGRLTLEEKVAQMSHGGAQNNGPAPAISRLGIKPYQWGTECLRGDVQTGVTAFAQGLGLSASFSRSVIYNMARAISDEVRAKNNDYEKHNNYGFHTGLSCWSPVINILRDPRWGRSQETYGEDPYLSGELAYQYVTGLQGDDKRYVEAVAGCKHYTAFGGPSNDGPVSNVSDYDIHQTFLPQFKRCVEAGTLSLMCSYSTINGVPACANEYTLTTVLRKQWGFEGYVVSDQQALEKTVGVLKVNYTQGAAIIAKAGCCLEDGNSQENVFAALTDAVNNKFVSESVLDDATSRLFYARMRLGEFDPVDMVKYKNLSLDVVDSPAHRSLAVEIAEKTFVLLKNNKNFLPLSTTRYKNIAVMGPHANNSADMFGDYSPTPNIQITPWEGISSFAKNNSLNILYTSGCSDIECANFDKASVTDTAKKSDISILFMGISTTQEREGRDRTQYSLPGKQMEMIQTAVEAGKPVILVLLGCTPMDITYAKQSDGIYSIVEAFYPAQATGTALTNMLFGKVSPAGRLPVTWPISWDVIPDIGDYTMTNRTYRYYKGPVMYPFGYGLSYTTFSYSSLKLSSSSIKPCEDLVVSFSVKNTGQVDSDEVVQVYIEWQESMIPHPNIQLAAFDRINIKAGQTSSVTRVIKARTMALWTKQYDFVISPGSFKVYIGGQQPGQTVSAPSNILESSFSVSGVQTPLSTCK